jgi:predicted membrane chloride channel (bestrophin family)
VSVEAFVRGYLLAFLVRLFLLFVVLNVVVLFFENWQWTMAVALSAAGLVVLVVNIRDSLRT